jgi:hypothetical protein
LKKNGYIAPRDKQFIYHLSRWYFDWLDKAVTNNQSTIYYSIYVRHKADVT